MVANKRTLLFPAFFLCLFWLVHIADTLVSWCPRTSRNFVKISFINNVLSACFFVSNIWCLWALEHTKKFCLRIYSIKIIFSDLQYGEREREEKAELRWCLVGGRIARSVATVAYVPCVCQNVHNVQWRMNPKENWGFYGISMFQGQFTYCIKNRRTTQWCRRLHVYKKRTELPENTVLSAQCAMCPNLL